MKMSLTKKLTKAQVEDVRAVRACHMQTDRLRWTRDGIECRAWAPPPRASLHEDSD